MLPSSASLGWEITALSRRMVGTIWHQARSSGASQSYLGLSVADACVERRCRQVIWLDQKGKGEQVWHTETLVTLPSLQILPRSIPNLGH